MWSRKAVAYMLSRLMLTFATHKRYQHHAFTVWTWKHVYNFFLLFVFSLTFAAVQSFFISSLDGENQELMFSFTYIGNPIAQISWCGKNSDSIPSKFMLICNIEKISISWFCFIAVKRCLQLSVTVFFIRDIREAFGAIFSNFSLWHW